MKSNALMFALLVSTSFGIHSISLLNTTYSLLLRLHPLDAFEISVPAGKATIFGGWENVGNMHLEVIMKTKQGKTYTYGPYSNSDDIYGVFFQSSDYVLRLINDNPVNVQFAIRMDDNLLPEDTSIYPNYYVLYQYPEMVKLPLNEIADPIIYSYSTQETYYLLLTCFLSAATSIYVIYAAINCRRICDVKKNST